MGEENKVMFHEMELDDRILKVLFAVKNPYNSFNTFAYPLRKLLNKNITF